VRQQAPRTRNLQDKEDEPAFTVKANGRPSTLLTS
jgi:hypothetical protein